MIGFEQWTSGFGSYPSATWATTTPKTIPYIHRGTKMLLNDLASEQQSNGNSVTSKKSPNVYQSCPKMIALEKLKILAPLQKLPKNVGDLGKLIVAKSFEKLPKVQYIAQSADTEQSKQRKQ